MSNTLTCQKEVLLQINSTHHKMSLQQKWTMIRIIGVGVEYKCCCLSYTFPRICCLLVAFPRTFDVLIIELVIIKRGILLH